MAHAIRFEKTGGPDVLAWQAVEVGKPGQGQVRLRHRAVGLNYIDTYQRSGLISCLCRAGSAPKERVSWRKSDPGSAT
jgi:NADPH:quinone reductase